jgi:drug/metabolite transporter (DMT)-like permease
MPSPAHLAPVLFSTAAIFLWGGSDFTGGVAARRVNAFLFTAAVHTTGLIFTGSLIFLRHVPPPSQAAIAWSAASGALGGFGLALFYRALASGKMGLNAPVSAVLSAVIPTLVDMRAQGFPGVVPVIGFLFAAAGVWLISRPEDGGLQPAGIGLAMIAGIGFGGFYLCAQQAGHESALWIAAISRVTAMLVTATAFLFSREPLRLGRTAAAMAIVAGLMDVSGTLAFVRASQVGRLDAAVVISSLYPAVTVLLAKLILKEHFTRWKAAGMAAAILAVPMIALG